MYKATKNGNKIEDMREYSIAIFKLRLQGGYLRHKFASEVSSCTIPHLIHEDREVKAFQYT